MMKLLCRNSWLIPKGGFSRSFLRFEKSLKKGKTTEACYASRSQWESNDGMNPFDQRVVNPQIDPERVNKGIFFFLRESIMKEREKARNVR